MGKGGDLIVIYIYILVSGCTTARTVQRFLLNVLASTFPGEASHGEGG